MFVGLLVWFQSQVSAAKKGELFAQYTAFLDKHTADNEDADEEQEVPGFAEWYEDHRRALQAEEARRAQEFQDQMVDKLFKKHEQQGLSRSEVEQIVQQCDNEYWKVFCRH